MILQMQPMRRASSPQGGHQLFTDSGTFTVPAGVTSVCILAIGQGGPYFDDDGAGNTGSGGGGACAWRNDLSVTPGGRINVVIQPSTIDPLVEGFSNARLAFSPFTTAVSVEAGRIPAAGIVNIGTGFNGGQGAYSDQGSGTMEGAGAGGRSVGQASNGTRARRGGGGTNPFAIGLGANAGAAFNSLDGDHYGGGAAYGGLPGMGCVLFMWGDGFSFPDNIVSP